MKRIPAINGKALKALRNKRLSQLKTEAEEVAPVVEEVVVEPQVVEKPKPKPSMTNVVKGSIIISSMPANARVLIGGGDTGQTTPAILTDLTLGEHTIEIFLEGYRPETFTITLTNEEAEKKEVTLTKAIGSLVLKIRPTANVYFDNVEKIIKEEGIVYPIETPRAKPLLIQTGTHKLTIKNESMDFDRTIDVEIFENLVTTVNWDIENENNPAITKE